MDSSLLVDNKTDALVCLPDFSGENYWLAGGPAFLILLRLTEANWGFSRGFGSSLALMFDCTVFAQSITTIY